MNCNIQKCKCNYYTLTKIFSLLVPQQSTLNNKFCIIIQLQNCILHLQPGIISNRLYELLLLKNNRPSVLSHQKLIIVRIRSCSIFPRKNQIEQLHLQTQYLYNESTNGTPSQIIHSVSNNPFTENFSANVCFLIGSIHPKTHHNSGIFASTFSSYEFSTNSIFSTLNMNK